ncbi:MAG: response regulator [Candidatus Nitrohelix vancouverensis]|uniref:Response regulator n=1 Tax=Candidatus Nitrohelix vancouverensis TaxID=2705534 RepID=A0A7T0C3U2_9BACT|nr:MAG: response regulator [Candidatus Nitrohelix vancouverensis]
MSDIEERVTAAEILKVVPITRKTLWLWQKKYKFFPDPQKEAHPGGKGIVGYYPAWVKERCKKVYALQKQGHTIKMIQDILEKEISEKSTKKILIVDDEVKFTNLLKNYFDKNGFLTETAYDGLEAGLKAAEFKPSIIILDLALPGLSGIKVCQKLRQNPTVKNAKVIVVSGDLRYSEADILEAGADQYFSKPVDFTQLLESCEKYVSSPLE